MDFQKCSEPEVSFILHPVAQSLGHPEFTRGAPGAARGTHYRGLNHGRRLGGRAGLWPRGPGAARQGHPTRRSPSASWRERTEPTLPLCPPLRGRALTSHSRPQPQVLPEVWGLLPSLQGVIPTLHMKMLPRGEGHRQLSAGVFQAFCRVRHLASGDQPSCPQAPPSAEQKAFNHWLLLQPLRRLQAPRVIFKIHEIMISVIQSLLSGRQGRGSGSLPKRERGWPWKGTVEERDSRGKGPPRKGMPAQDRSDGCGNTGRERTDS